MVASDPFADHVQVRRPPLPVAVVGKADRRDIVDQRVVPNVNGVVRIAGERDPPLALRTGHRDVLEPFLDDVTDLVTPDLRLHELRVLVKQPEQRIAESRKLEEVVVLPGPADLAVGVLGAAAVDEVLLLLKRLAPFAVVPFVGVLEDVARLARTLDHLHHSASVPGLRGADEVVVADLQLIPRLRENARHLVHPGLRAEARLGGGLQDGLRVLVHPDYEVDVVTAEAPVTGDGVGADLLEGVTQVRVAIRVVDGRGDVILGQRYEPLSCSARSCELRPSLASVPRA